MMDDDKFWAIPPAAIMPGSMPRFRIYMRPSKGRYILWALEGNEVSSEQISKLTNSGVNEVYVALEEKFKYEQYLESNLGNILENKTSSDEQKAAIFSKVSTKVVKDAFENCLGIGSMSANALKRTQIMVKHALMFISESHSLPALAKMIGHDYQTYEHATKVLWFTVAFLRENQTILEQIQPEYRTFDESRRLEMMRQCGVGALLHDIGKAFVSPEILNKDGALTATEWEIMKRHPLNGLAMLLDTETPSFVKKAVLQHHEDYRGGGYPMSVEGVNITTLARVLRIVDVFDAMTSRRPYKAPIPPAKAVQIMAGVPDKKKDGENQEPDERDRGMRKCFDEELLKKFIVFLGKVTLGQ